MITRDALLIYHDFNQHFDIHKDTRELQIGAVIVQNGKPVAFFSYKLPKPQQRYTVKEKVLLSKVETLK